MAKDALTERLRKDGQLRDTAERVREFRRETATGNPYAGLDIAEMFRRHERGESYDYLAGIPTKRYGNSVTIPAEYGIVHSDGNRYPVVVAPYVDARPIIKQLGLPNAQAHHVAQNAIYGNIVAKSEGITISVEGDAIREIGSPHNEMHIFSDAQLDVFREAGTVPTNVEYAEISARAMLSVGYNEVVTKYVIDQVIQQQLAHGLLPNMPIPKMPRKLYFGSTKTMTKKELYDESVL